MERQEDQHSPIRRVRTEPGEKTPERIIEDIASPILALALARASMAVLSDYDVWHQFVHEQKEKYKHTAPEIFEKFKFDQSHDRPWSPQVGKFLYDLGDANIFEMGLSIKHEPVFIVKPDGKRLIEDRLGFRYSLYSVETSGITVAMTESLGVELPENSES